MSVVYFLLLVGLLVAIHELGHFAAARLVGVRVLRFSLGFGPALFTFRTKHTEYRLGALPVGGYVRLLGEESADEVPPEERHRSFSAKPLWKRALVVMAGPAANFLFPFVVYFVLFAGHTQAPVAQIGDVFAGSPAAEAGLLPGDRILEVSGQRVRYWQDLEEAVHRHGGETLRLKVRRARSTFHVYVTPRAETVRHRDGRLEKQGLIGVRQSPFPPQIGVLDPSSPAGRAGLATGDLVASVNGTPVDSWGELEGALERHPKRASLAILRPQRAAVGFADIHVLEPHLTDLVADLQPTADGHHRRVTGLSAAELVLSRVEEGSPAWKAGLRPGDLVESLDGTPVTSWRSFEQALLEEPDRPREIAWLRPSEGGAVRLSGRLVQERRRVRDEYGHAHEVIVLGVGRDLWPGRPVMAPIEGRFTYALENALSRTGESISVMVRGFGTLLSGEAPHETVGGPLMIYRYASVSGEKGWDSFLLMLALISINLGLLNLLPIPVLDGGHLLLQAVETLRRRRLSPRVREVAGVTGLVMIVSLAVLALRNDVVRYLWP